MTAVAAADVRPMSWTDLADVDALERLLFPADGWPLATWWAELAARPRREYVVACVADSVVGYAGIDHAGNTADVMTIGVSPAVGGRGVGRILLGELLTRAARDGAEAVLLEVRADNAAAIGLYRSAGFETIQTRRRYYQPGDVDALVMRKLLFPQSDSVTTDKEDR